MRGIGRHFGWRFGIATGVCLTLAAAAPAPRVGPRHGAVVIVGGGDLGPEIWHRFIVRGARDGNGIIVAPAYEKGFGFLQGVGIDQHVVAREQLADLADSLLPRFPDLLGMSEDEGTAWVVLGDTATIITRDKAFVYGGHDSTDFGKPFLTLYPGDRYDLAALIAQRPGATVQRFVPSACSRPSAHTAPWPGTTARSRATWTNSIAGTWGCLITRRSRRQGATARWFPGATDPPPMGSAGTSIPSAASGA